MVDPDETFNVKTWDELDPESQRAVLHCREKFARGEFGSFESISDQRVRWYHLLVGIPLLIVALAIPLAIFGSVLWVPLLLGGGVRVDWTDRGDVVAVVIAAGFVVFLLRLLWNVLRDL